MPIVVDAILEIVKSFEANYPETLKAAYVVNGEKHHNYQTVTRDKSNKKIFKSENLGLTLCIMKFCSDKSVFISILPHEAIAIPADIW